MSELCTFRSVGLWARGRWSSSLCVRRRLRYETALAEANSFLSECQPFGNIARAISSGHGSSGADVTSVLVDTQFGGGGGGSEQV